MSITITLEEPYELLIYCGKQGCDWRLRDPKTKRFIKAPIEIYFICHKRGSLDTKKAGKRVTIEAEMQGVCAITREWIRENTDINEINEKISSLEAKCISCEIVSKCIGNELLDYLISDIAIDSVAHSFSINYDTCYLHIEERYAVRFYERSYEGELVDCFE